RKKSGSLTPSTAALTHSQQIACEKCGLARPLLNGRHDAQQQSHRSEYTIRTDSHGYFTGACPVMADVR
ncbi:MAG: hypothetical protein KDA60_16475, partial [Planctomycetales bacterium]|nr:hypothetical protein [Planctomycetales bacterium]